MSSRSRARTRTTSIGDREMELRMRIQSRAEAVQKGDGAQAGILGKGAAHRDPKLAANRPKQDTKHRACHLSASHEVRPQPLRHGRHPWA